jgi:LysR family glycine cleavage system transcriptional activator
MASAINQFDGSNMADMPPLQAVRVFESVARHGNFTRAAAELNMTQSAVSYQIKLLEDFVGAPLFQRLARGVALTDGGRAIAQPVQRALADLRQSFRRVREETSSILVISTMQTIASAWLAPRLGRFQLDHPQIAVRLDVSSRLVDFESEGVDVAIRSGKGKWEGLASHLLLEQCFTAVSSPEYLAREGKPHHPAELLDRALVSPRDEWWPVWFAAAGVTAPKLSERRGIDVDYQQMAARVAIGGHGIALVTPGFVQEELASEKLVRLFDITASAGTGYYLVCPERHKAQRKIRLFRDWVLKEAGRA